MQSLHCALLQGPLWLPPMGGKSARTEEVAKYGYVLTPGRYVGAEDAEDDAVPFEERIASLQTELEHQFSEAERSVHGIQSLFARLSS